MDQLIYLFHLLLPHTVDLLLVLLTFFAGRMSGGLGVFFWITTLIARILVEWFRLHPVGQKIASITQLDEKLHQFCSTKLGSPSVAACGGKGDDV